jgi:glutamyl-tRNA synthetase
MGSDSIRVRFAPSPTGHLHVGGVRTALFNWLYAKRFGGKFLLRIEDTDTERSEAQYTDDILASMRWLGLTWDEDLVYQSRRFETYKAKAESLIAKGLAYRCTCTPEAVEEMRKRAEAKGEKPQYDRTCRDRNLPADPGTPHVIRVKIPLEGHREFNDLIRGPIRFQNTEVDDFVILRSNGAPIYNLTVVVDDGDQRITHVIRGDDHINNTPKQLFLYEFLGYPLLVLYRPTTRIH